MFNLLPLPSWLPALVQPQDWFICQILAILLIVAGGIVVLKGGEN